MRRDGIEKATCTAPAERGVVSASWRREPWPDVDPRQPGPSPRRRYVETTPPDLEFVGTPKPGRPPARKSDFHKFVLFSYLAYSGLGGYSG